MSRDELIAHAERIGVPRSRVLRRIELIDEIIARTTMGEHERAKARGWLGRARDLLATVVEHGLHLPAAVRAIRPGKRPRAWPTPPPPLPTVTLADIYAAQGHVDRAIAVLDDVLAREPESAEAHALRARLLEQGSNPVYTARKGFSAPAKEVSNMKNDASEPAETKRGSVTGDVDPAAGVQRVEPQGLEGSGSTAGARPANADQPATLPAATEERARGKGAAVLDETSARREYPSADDAEDDGDGDDRDLNHDGKDDDATRDDGSATEATDEDAASVGIGEEADEDVAGVGDEDEVAGVGDEDEVAGVGDEDEEEEEDAEADEADDEEEMYEDDEPSLPERYEVDEIVAIAVDPRTILCLLGSAGGLPCKGLVRAPRWVSRDSRRERDNGLGGASRRNPRPAG